MFSIEPVGTNSKDGLTTLLFLKGVLMKIFFFSVYNGCVCVVVRELDVDVNVCE